MNVHVSQAIKSLSTAITDAIKQGDKQALSKLQSMRSEMEEFYSDLCTKQREEAAARDRTRRDEEDDEEDDL